MVFKVAVTGHRNFPAGEKEKERFFTNLTNFFEDFCELQIDSSKVSLLHGCARGVDLWFGEYACTHGSGLELYLPFPRKMQIVAGKFERRHINSLNYQMYRYKHLKKTYVVSERYYTQVYGDRNRVLVNNCDLLLTYYTRERSGSGHAARVAKLIGRPLVHLYDYTERQHSLNWINSGKEDKYARFKRVFKKAQL